jgi:hypothetical protein
MNPSFLTVGTNKQLLICLYKTFVTTMNVKSLLTTMNVLDQNMHLKL